ncbi:MAG: hypothetical protein FK733_14825 [Asgard group archaeon]|nr:hypothetical protein [Asgard group archaeon]
MKFSKYGNKIDNPKDTIPPLDFAKSDVFCTLNILLRKLKAEKPGIYQSFKEKVTEALNKEIQQDYFENHQDRIDDLLTQYDYLKEESEFVRLHLSFQLQTLQISVEELFENQKTAFPTTNFIPSSFGLFFFQVTALIELLGREQGLKFFQEFIDAYNIEINAIYQKDRFTDLQEFRTRHTKWIQKNPYGRFQILSYVENDQLINLHINCEKYNSMIQTKFGQDKEILFTIMCYMHKPLARVWNENIRLELNKSLALGDNFCSYIYHDVRNESGIKQFSDEYLEKVWEEHK